LRKFIIGLLTLISLAIPALCQDRPPVEVYGQYSYMNIDAKQLTSRQNANGWEAGTAVIFTRLFAGEFQAAGYYNRSSFMSQNINVRDYYFLAGPRFSYKSLFAHALFGGDHLWDPIFSANVAAQGFAMALGGGVNRKINGNWGIRGSFDYVLSRHSIFSTSSFGQDNYRAGIGLAYTFGRKSIDMQ
jgi:hypothetical protein